MRRYTFILMLVAVVLLTVFITGCATNESLSKPENPEDKDAVTTSGTLPGTSLDIDDIEKIDMGTPIDDVHAALGDPAGQLSGLWGDVYALEDGGKVIFYYDADGLVERINKLPANENSSVSPDSVSAVSDDYQFIAAADVNRDDSDESFYLDKTHMNTDLYITLHVCDNSGKEIWSEDLAAAHAGWDSLFLCELDDEIYMLRYKPGMFQGYCDYAYSVFTLEGGTENVFRSGKLEFDINGNKEFNAFDMVSFADEVNALLENSILLVSSSLSTGGDGGYSFGPSSSEPFYERFSWLDGMPELYNDGDDLETRLSKFSDYAVSNYGA